jgi:Secretion system C-terminal sorting domain
MRMTYNNIQPIQSSTTRRLSSRAFPAILIMLVLGLQPAFSQLVESPLSHEGYPLRSGPNLRTKSGDPVSLPFWDDFSSTNPGYPDTLWVNSNSVYISNGIGVDAPTLNVATFDGLDSLGSPYNPNEPSINGFTDKLVSREIKMSAVPVGERGSVYLSFFYQWRGNGEPPDKNDFLRIEFKNDQGIWVEAYTIYGDEIVDPNAFNNLMLPVTGDEFFHDGFQFRLRSYGRMSGPFDTWIVDYVYLNKGRSLATPSFPDRAAASAISKLFGRYYAVPLKHFFADKQIDSVTFDVQNLRGTDFGGASINYRMNAKFYTYMGANPPAVYGKNLIKSRGVKGTSGVMLPYERVTVRLDTLPDPNNPLQFNPDADAIEIQLKMKVISSDSIDPERPNFLPLDFRVNDTTSAKYTLRDYYAYDDGAAEYSVGLTQPGNRLAYRFDMPVDTATLVGFGVYFPYLGGSNSESLDMFIYANEDDHPTINPLYSILSKTITKNTNNEFLYVPLQPPLFINDSVFYIGYKEPVSSKVKVGLDKSNDTGDKMYIYTGSSWIQNTDIQGSLMIRPFFGGGADPVTGLPEESPVTAIHPNPNNGVFYIEGDIDELVIMDIMGRKVQWDVKKEALQNRVAITSHASGMYIVTWANRKGIHQHKILVQP